MKITENINWKINIADIETLAEYTLLSFYNTDTEEWNEFEIGEFKNDILSFVKFYDKNNIDYNVFYNGIRFDGPILEHIYRSYENWMNLSGIEIARKIYIYAQDVVSNSNYGALLEYREDSFSVKVLDPFTILGLDNEARRSSLKKVQFQLDLPSVEEMPIHHSRTNLTLEEIEQVKSYCRNDILSLYQLFKLVLGDTTHPIYKGINQLELRLSIQEEFKIDCLNYSDIKIGDELMKKSYCEEKGIELKDLSKKGTFRKEIKLSNCIPKYVEFKTPILRSLLSDLKKKIINQKSTHEVTFKYGHLNTEYTIGLGGGHSSNKNQIWEEDENNVIIDLDVQSLYPAIICNEEYYPKHLGKELLKVYKKLYNRRIELKPLSKTDKKIKGICDAIKLLLNSAYGKMGSMDSWMYDKQVPYAVCLTGQLNLLMLIEEMELNGIYCFSFNTDGATFKINRKLLPKFYEIWKWWEEKTNLLLEEAKFKKFVYSTVNDYIAITTEGKIKKKGDYISDYELWKNKSWRVVSLSLEEYFIKGTNPIEFITNHKNIYDFCLMARASGDLYLEMQGNKKTEKLKKLVRYYLTTDKERQLYKRGIGSTGKPANISLHADNELGSVYVKYFNQFEEKEDYNIDYKQYIYKALKIIDAVEKTNKLKSYLNSINNSSQLSLF